jgi:hypothetical protein
VWRRGKRIDNGDAAPGEAFVHVLRYENAATGFGRGGQDDRVPDRQAMIDCNLHCTSKHRVRRTDHGVSGLPDLDCASGLYRASTRLPNEDAEQFPQYLCGQHDTERRNGVDEVGCQFLLAGVLQSLRVDEDVGIQGR